ncbi:hypothetical protein B0A58_00240 [Flavobacterium branchiophilum NBRC 15030 = ATCC 35035]|uniref:Uncharacterized protein DUF4237 n=1 Tax=Flavobacterium branchiophilum TaxID=55197 RepID=A0A543G6V0_9FLAO|nr:TNT domain-containing protein [Flavobacterium branchiophilum]OXA82339.1 hypothetical protein B0A58_00240 [Flavobacterium branchiophilum NBRC 15030 = ATCC 35035]TQM41811.1 uncharacterized protein DUF4237 [Flavobacterium branchiophilum]GEM56358.1 hypothetical protein FB1_25790 [Flavobacterium branchiophilum NBRC 15030 = ATCC 35035]
MGSDLISTETGEAFFDGAIPEYESIKRIATGNAQPQDAMLLLYLLKFKTPKEKPVTEEQIIEEPVKNNNITEPEPVKKKADGEAFEMGNSYKLPTFDEFLKTIDGGFPSEELGLQAYDLFKNRNWSALEKLFKDNNLNGNWPPNRGAVGTTNTTLNKGSTFDRFGGWVDENGNFQDKGTFAGKEGTPYTERALPKGTDAKPYKRYEVIKEIPTVSKGEIIPWFGEKGGGIQYELPASINDLIKEGYIKPIN